MRKVQKFQAEDGTLFDNESGALNRDTMLADMEAVSKLLGKAGKMSDIDFGNGGGYYQLTPAKIRAFDRAFLDLLRKYETWIFTDYVDKPEFNKGKPFSDAELINSYIVGRGLSDSNSPLYSLLSTRMCIDSQSKLWGQPYFAMNPGKGTNKNLGDL